ncbi:hypothetical protein HYS48_01265 [Candidatus Woesearchaeota archaeon]|nr:hypothetical protein [Candidatus Woesearchaeota archaeon]
MQYKHLLLRFLLMIFLAVFLFGCATQPQAAPGVPTAPSPAPGQPAVQPTPAPTATPGAEGETVIAPSQEYSPELKKQLDKIAKIKSYSFYYGEGKPQFEADQWFVKGDKVKIVMFEINAWRADQWIDTVYLDRSTRTGVGYCERREPYRCRDRNRVFDLEYKYFDLTLPMDWIAEIPADAKVSEGGMIDDRFTKKIVYEKGGRQVTLFVDEFSGIPMQVQIMNGEEEFYYFRDMAINAVKDADLVHQIQ